MNDYSKTAIAIVLLSAAMSAGAQSATGNPSETSPGTTPSPAATASPSTTDPATTDEATSSDQSSATDEMQPSETLADNRLPSTASPLWLATLAGGGVFVMLGGSLRYLRRRQSA